MRRPRILVEGAWYHVTARVNRQEMLFSLSEERELFLAFLARTKRRYRFQIANFCIMGNHVHMMIQPGEHESLSDIMRWLLGGFAKAYNKKHGLTGHFWGDRFYSRVLEGIRQIAITFGYIDENPVKAGLVARTCDWRHSGAWHSLMRESSIIDCRTPWMALLESLRQMPLGIAWAI